MFIDLAVQLSSLPSLGNMVLQKGKWLCMCERGIICKFGRNSVSFNRELVQRKSLIVGAESSTGIQ